MRQNLIRERPTPSELEKLRKLFWNKWLSFYEVDGFSWDPWVEYLTSLGCYLDKSPRNFLGFLGKRYYLDITDAVANGANLDDFIKIDSYDSDKWIPTFHIPKNIALKMSGSRPLVYGQPWFIQ